MNKNILIALAVIAVGGGALVISRQDTSTPTMQKESQTETIEPTSLNRYRDYTSELAATASDTQKVVIFFHAAWCPTCQVAERNFTENHDSIPEDVLILKTDYDSSDELKKKYRVNYQHTFVQIDSKGNQITQWNGGDLTQLTERVQ